MRLAAGRRPARHELAREGDRNYIYTAGLAHVGSAAVPPQTSRSAGSSNGLISRDQVFVYGDAVNRPCSGPLVRVALRKGAR